jgi:NAD(P)-dependent dehydrogenase (short-subunit alcohol dehydrogenase family)
MRSPAIIITGANSGIGKATVELFAARGWSVIATMRRPELAGMFAHLANVEVMPLDVANPRSIEAFATLVLESGREIDVLVNNAGYLQVGPLEATSMEQVRAQFETNVFGLMAMSKAFLPHFRKRRAGTIINISSISADNGYPFAAAYSATKGAVLSLTEALNIECESIGVTCKAILPGMHKTDIFASLDPAKNIPTAYKSAMTKFNAILGTIKGSKPEVAAETVWRAVNDRKTARLRYYSGPDAKLIPIAKRLLGLGGYFSFFRKIMLKGPSPLIQRLSPQGKEDMNINVEKTATYKA